jgi:serine/threonine-protein kinase
VISLVSQIASAVDYAHSKGVIHRDIKPSNLILYDEDRVKVTDFGIAKLADSEMTQSGTLLGTPAYMSPEQAMGDKLDGRSDIFSLGVCAFEMLSGEQPFAGPNVTAILYKLVHVEPIEPANLEMNGLVPQKWREVFGKVLAKKPDDRYQNATEFVQDLEYCLGSWFGSAMLDTLVEDDAPLRAAAQAAAASGMAAPPPAAGAPPPGSAAPPPPIPAAASLPAAPLSAAPPPAPVAVPSLAFDEVTAALPRPEDLSSLPFVEDDLPETLAMTAATGPIDTDTIPVDLPAAPPLPPPVPPARPAPPAATHASSAPEPVAGPTVVIPAPSATEKTVLMSAASLVPAAAPARRGGPAARATPPAPPPGAPPPVPPTVLMPTPPLARPAPAAVPAPPARPVAKPPAAAVQTSELPASFAPEVAAGARPRKAPGLLLAGGAAAVFVMALVVGVVLFKGGGDVAATPPSPTPATPTPVRRAARPTAAPTVEAPAPAGLLRVATQPAGATVTVNGEARGATPLELGGLALGAHEVRVELRGYAPAVQRVELTSQAPQAELSLALSRSAPVSGIAELHSSPQGAFVRIDGIAVGQTPMRQSLRLGGHAVELIKEGYEPWSTTLDVTGRGTARVDAVLRSVAPATPTPEPVDVARVYAPSEVDTQPRRLSGSSAPYPASAPRLRPGRDVTVAGTFVVSEEGEIIDLRIVESAGEVVDQAVMAAVRNWKYSPGARRGVKVKVRVPFKQTFRAG